MSRSGHQPKQSLIQSVNQSEIRIQTILLLRLWHAGDSGEVRSKLSGAVEGFFHGTRAELRQEIHELVDQGFVVAAGRKGARLTITAVGEERLEQTLNVSSENLSLSWAKLWTLVLVPAALGHGPRQAEQMANADGFRAALLAGHIGLPWRKGLTERQAVNALLKQITGARQDDANALRKAVVHGAVKRAASPGHGPSVDPDRIVTTPPAPSQPMPLPEFAGAVGELASSCPSGKVGPRKVLINHVWRHARRQGSPAVPDSLAEFKQRLTDCLTRNLLHLSRADLAPAFDPADISESEIVHLGELFHYILLD